MKKNIWYCHENLKPVGPFSEEQMRKKIHSGEVGPQELICDASGEWRPAIDWRVFESQLFPASQAVIKEDRTVSSQESVSLQSVGLRSPASSVAEWVVLVLPESDNEKPLQEGPFTTSELRELITDRKISPYAYIWKTGLSGWCQLKDRPEFSGVLTSGHLSDPSPV